MREGRCRVFKQREKKVVDNLFITAFQKLSVGNRDWKSQKEFTVSNDLTSLLSTKPTTEHDLVNFPGYHCSPGSEPL